MKRYTDTEIWENKFFFNLSPFGKLAYQYIKDKCNGVGVWNGNWEFLKLSIRYEDDIDIIMTELGVVPYFSYTKKDKLVILPNDKILVTNFLKFQFPKGLKSKKPMVVGALSKAKEDLEVFDILVEINGEDFFNEDDSVVPLPKCEVDTVKDPEIDDKEKDLTPLARCKIIIDENFSSKDDRDNIMVVFKKYLTRRQKMRKSMTDRGVQMLLKKLFGRSAEFWIECISDSTDNSWLSVFPENKKYGNGIVPVPDAGKTFDEEKSKSLVMNI